MKNLWKLYITFVKIGAFMFGGGYSMLPLLSRELVDRLGWATDEELLDYFAIAQCTPGVIAVNTAGLQSAPSLTGGEDGKRMGTDE